MAATRLSSWLLMAMLMMSLMTLVPVCEGQENKVSFNVKAWLQLMQEKIHDLKRAVEKQKRGCNGFPCMYTHLGAQAGRQAYMEVLMSKLSRCAHDPSCSPGKRRRRSAPAEVVLALLTQHQRKDTS